MRKGIVKNCACRIGIADGAWDNQYCHHSLQTKGPGNRCVADSSLKIERKIFLWPTSAPHSTAVISSCDADFSANSGQHMVEQNCINHASTRFDIRRARDMIASISHSSQSNATRWLSANGA